MQNTTLSSIDRTKLMPFTVGFDDLFDRLFDLNDNNTGYPPYNISKKDDFNYVIEMALAGFKKKDIEIELSDGNLSVRSLIHSNDEDNSSNFIHKGISQRAFVRKFTLSDEIRVKNAELNDGMLKINLEKLIPEHKKPKMIQIK
tara:strand:+ start:126 stop:557 length:432 start_codon:yes stop_codon:yes gene_type:complete